MCRVYLWLSSSVPASVLPVLSRYRLVVMVYVCIYTHVSSEWAVSASPASPLADPPMPHRGKKTVASRHGRPRKDADNLAEVDRQKTAKAAALSLALPAELAEAKYRSREGRYPGGAAQAACPYTAIGGSVKECTWCHGRRFRQCRLCGHISYVGNFCCLRWACRAYAHSYAVAFAEQLNFPLVIGRWDACLAGREWLSG